MLTYIENLGKELKDPNLSQKERDNIIKKLKDEKYISERIIGEYIKRKNIDNRFNEIIEYEGKVINKIKNILSNNK